MTVELPTMTASSPGTITEKRTDEAEGNFETTSTWRPKTNVKTTLSLPLVDIQRMFMLGTLVAPAASQHLTQSRSADTHGTKSPSTVTRRCGSLHHRATRNGMRKPLTHARTTTTTKRKKKKKAPFSLATHGVEHDNGANNRLQTTEQCCVQHQD